MCQYSSTDGKLIYWHKQQWASLYYSGANLCIIEATAIEPKGRISFADLWKDRHCAQIKTIAPTPFAVQLTHAGRKSPYDTR